MKWTEEQQTRLQQISDKMEQKLEATRARLGDTIPFVPVQGHYRDLMLPMGITWWCNGFWPGILWQMNHATNNPGFAETAKAVDQRLMKALDTPEKLDHDVGFLFLLSAVPEYQATGNEAAKSAALHAARLLEDRFHEKARYIQAWNPGTLGETDVTGMMIADCMMNLSLLFWASTITGDPRYHDIAVAHADTTAKFVVRPEGSSNHIAVLDPETGEFKSAPAGQGYAEGSSWSRGQSWILYGFANAYRHTGNDAYLTIARREANYCIAALAVHNWLPAVDFRAPMDDGREDASAGMIIASGLMELAQHVPEGDAALYRTAAYKILDACESRYASWDMMSDGIIHGCSNSYHNDRMAGMSIIYGDYFFVETVLRMTDRYLQVW